MNVSSSLYEEDVPCDLEEENSVGGATAPGWTSNQTSTKHNNVESNNRKSHHQNEHQAALQRLLKNSYARWTTEQQR